MAEDVSPRDPRTVLVKQDGGGDTSITPGLPLTKLEGEEEKDISDPVDLNPCSATYSNLGKYRCHVYFII